MIYSVVRLINEVACYFLEVKSKSLFANRSHYFSSGLDFMMLKNFTSWCNFITPFHYCFW